MGIETAYAYNAKGDYWNNFYSKEKSPKVPSQFAVFVASEYPECSVFVDIGCGNGRDSFFFASQGKSVVSVDGSESAVTLIDTVNDGRFDIKALCSSVDAPQLSSEIVKRLPEIDGLAILYARFFLHAINEEEEDAFLAACIDVMKKAGNAVLAVEFRTIRDRGLQKETRTHYRRYIDPVDFIQKVNTKGLSVKYFVEGFGYAKYKSDDAHVARLVLSL
jgi:SAM-dependent methyltransferase